MVGNAARLTRESTSMTDENLLATRYHRPLLNNRVDDP